jgi:hypothetical protein
MTHDELENYINSFREDQREVVYKQIIDSELLQKAFSTSEGKLILDSAVDLIASNVMQIVRECAQIGEEPSQGVDRAAREINTTYKLMTDWAKILIRGSEHKTKIDKLG